MPFEMKTIVYMNGSDWQAKKGIAADYSRNSHSLNASDG